MRRLLVVFAALTAAAVAAALSLGSSHREAPGIALDPSADNTDTYAWVSNATHDKLYLIMNFNPLHEPGQGNQGLRACNGYRYEFHIGKGTSLADQAVYRVENHDWIGKPWVELWNESTLPASLPGRVVGLPRRSARASSGAEAGEGCTGCRLGVRSRPRWAERTSTVTKL